MKMVRSAARCSWIERWHKKQGVIEQYGLSSYLASLVCIDISEVTTMNAMRAMTGDALKSAGHTSMSCSLKDQERLKNQIGIGADCLSRLYYHVLG